MSIRGDVVNDTEISDDSPFGSSILKTRLEPPPKTLVSYDKEPITVPS